MPKLSNVLVYEWQAWKGFLISHLIADYCRIEASFDDELANLEYALSPNIKAVLLQINLSRSKYFPAKRPGLIKSLQDRGLLVLNHAVADITKRNLYALLEAVGIATARATIEGNPEEFLFVKSNLNWGGVAEQRLPEHIREKFDEPTGMSITKHDQYYLRQRQDLTPEHWQDDSVVIEKYIANCENSFYRIYAFGDALVIVKAHTIDLIKKISGDKNDINYFYSKEEIIQSKTLLPDNLNKTLKQFVLNIPLDYFCLDVVHDTNNFFIIDLNLTPWSGVQDQSQEAIEFLCQGGHCYLKRMLEQ